MILNYYQAVDLMSALPVILSHATVINIQDTNTKSATETEEEFDTNGIVEMWSMPTQGIEVNGAAFY